MRTLDTRGSTPAGDATNAAYARLRALIVDGLLAPGSPLIESDVSARLGVSRTPLRAALLRLEQEGFVRRAATRAGGLRAIVAPLTVDDLQEIFLMAGALESIAARQAAALAPRSRGPIATAIERANDEMRTTVTRRPPDLLAAQDAHLRLHRACVEAAGGSRLLAELETLAPQAERYQRAYSVATLYAIEELAAAHARIATAIRAGDGDGAEQATMADWCLAADRHREMAAILGERGNW